MNNQFYELSFEDSLDVNGGALGGAIAGGIYGLNAGMLAWVGSGGAGGMNGLWKCCTATTLSGVAIGLMLPV